MTDFSSTPDPGSSPDAQPQTKADCAEVMAEVWSLLDGECTAEKQQKLRQHLEDCPPCFQLYGLEERIKGLISTKCRGERAPDRLRARLRLEISRTTIIRGG
ncbi:MAG TPA: mycothiol system anti-sigma-R factor [Mycobacterium sp.]|jgi:mycothiol system anti-sigma-R factor|uniref:mycothiol system anti-sigma-R factor n=1 Tax=Mycobacterium sp. TaxID=1785 RepID=UPI002F429ADB